MSLLIVGSIALDTLKTPHGDVNDAIGGSTVYAAYAAAHFTKTSIVGVVGGDFPKRELGELEKRGVDTKGVETVSGGQTFRWGGKYFDDMNRRETLFTELGVFAEFSPKIPESYKKIQTVFLANIDPDLQLDVLSQVGKPRLVVCDTMNLWIDIKRQSLQKLLKKIDALLLNDEEALMLSEEKSLVEAANKLRKGGIERVIVKKGEHGSIMFGPEGVFALPALPLSKVKDPTGAGDSFAGGMVGYLASHPMNPANWRRALAVGTATASFCVEDFSIRKVRKATREEVLERARQLRDLTQIPKF
jgi:sugar/nucleoside kinase (ribokinase family)